MAVCVSAQVRPDVSKVACKGQARRGAAISLQTAARAGSGLRRHDYLNACISACLDDIEVELTFRCGLYGLKQQSIFAAEYGIWEILNVIMMKHFTTPVKTQLAMASYILHLRIPGTMPGGYPEYPDPLRGDLLPVVVNDMLLTLQILTFVGVRYCR